MRTKIVILIDQAYVLVNFFNYFSARPQAILHRLDFEHNKVKFGHFFLLVATHADQNKTMFVC